ncbi:MAG: hypothetical protein IT448_03215 [Phycisphaerales bacterium]|nr:hypothetical protein [Phycisphaerales bacterium]
MARTTILMALMAALCGTEVSGQTPENRDETDQFNQRYGVVIQDNIFLRQRGQRTVEPTTRPAAPPRTIEQSLMLTGVVFEDGQVRAYFENLSGGAPVRVSPGESIGKGVVTEIAIDAVAYLDSQGRSRWVEIGHDLTGASVVVDATPAGASSSPTTATAGGKPAEQDQAATDPAALSTLERLRQNRQRIINRNP